MVIPLSKRTFWCACAAASQACGVSYSATTVWFCPVNIVMSSTVIAIASGPPHSLKRFLALARGLQDSDDLLIAASSGVSDGRNALLVGNRSLHPGIHQELDDSR